jgi:hypothetical protein
MGIGKPNVRSDQHELLLNCDKAPFVLKGLRSPSIKEPPVEVTINNEAVGHFQGLEVFEKVSKQKACPQTIADIVSNMYFRLTYQKPDGTSATFGTSIIGAMSFRTVDHTLHLLPHVTGAAVHLGEPDRLRMSVSGVYGDIASLSSIRTYATTASIFQTTMTAEVHFTALKDIHLDRSRLGKDSFRLFSISSMYANPLRYDGNLIKYKSAHGIKVIDMCNIQKRGKYIVDANQTTSEIELVKEIGSTGALANPGSPDSPSIRACIVASSVPTEELVIQGYLDDSIKVNDDSLSVWLEWARCPAVIAKGRKISAKIEFSAIPPEDGSLPCAGKGSQCRVRAVD